MKQAKLTIHSENILPIIKKWLYSEKDIFLRELVSNGCDALSKMQILQSKNISHTQEDLKIEITFDKNLKTLTISDNGIGMTEEEVEKYIAQIAFSSLEEFVEKYESKDQKDQIIGHFGLGFYSAYMVADSVEIETLSFEKEAKAVHWECDGSIDYQIGPGKRETKGTSVILHLSSDNYDYLEENILRGLIRKYCHFLSFPILLNGKKINSEAPLYLKAPKDCTKEDYLKFYEELYPFQKEPLFWIHIFVDYPFHLKGILYFPKIEKNSDLTENSLQLYCNRVFVSDNCRDFLPDYLTILKGALDSFDIPLNVSRSYLQKDAQVIQIGQHIAKKASDALHQLYQEDKARYEAIFPDCEIFLKLGILRDEKFYEKVKDILLWKNTKNTWTTLDEYINRNKDKTNDQIFYATEENLSCSLISLLEEKNYEILITNPRMDIALMGYLEEKQKVHFKRIDSSLDSSFLDPSKEKSELDKNGKSEAALISEFVQSLCKIENCNIEAKSLSSEKIPAFFLISEEERRMQDYFKMMQKDAPGLPPLKKTLCVNTNNPIITKAFSLRKKKPKLSEALIQHVIHQANFAQNNLSMDNIQAINVQTNELIEMLLNK
jgi:molecular chaperone HtpG